MTHNIPNLPFDYEGLEPVISRETIDYHYGKHEVGYFNNLNKLIAGTDLENLSIAEIIRRSEGAVFNNAAQAWNHVFYFESFSPEGGGEIPASNLREAIIDTFGSEHQFKEQFEVTGTQLFGSGWVWLVSDISGNLSILPTSNADNPLKRNLVPLLCFDVWEHAHYIDYRNRRADYLHKLWDIVNWNRVIGRYQNLLL